MTDYVFDGDDYRSVESRLVWLVNSIGAYTRTNRGGEKVDISWDNVKAKAEAVRLLVEKLDEAEERLKVFFGK